MLSPAICCKWVHSLQSDATCMHIPVCMSATLMAEDHVVCTDIVLCQSNTKLCIISLPVACISLYNTNFIITCDLHRCPFTHSLIHILIHLQTALGYVSLPSGLITTPPPPLEEGQFLLGDIITRAHGVRGKLIALDNSTLLLKHFYFDGNAPGRYCMT